MATPSTVLFMAANPAAGAPLRLDEECRAIERRINEAKFGDRLRLRSRWAARPDDLLQALNEDVPAVLHFSGHGTGRDGLCFQSDDGQPVYLNAAVLGQLIRAAGASVTLVVLNACFSDLQAEALVADVPCVIGMTDAIGDQAAIVYAAAFYRALAYGKSVANAHEQGIAALALPGARGSGRDVYQVAASSVPEPRLWTRGDTDAACVCIVPANERRRYSIVIEATLEEIESDTVARLVDALQGLTGDMSVKIVAVDRGSVRLTVSFTREGADAIARLWSEEKLTELCGFSVSAVQDLGREASLEQALQEAEREASLEQARQEKEHRAELVAPDRVAMQRDSDAAARRVEVVLEKERTRASDVFVRVGAGLDRDADIFYLLNKDRESALRLLMKRYGDSIFRFCRIAVNDAALAEDIVQQVFITASRDLPMFSQTSTLRNWLFGIAHHRVLDGIQATRRARARVSMDEPDKIEGRSDPGQELDEAWLRRALAKCVQALPASTRMAVLLRYVHGLSFEEMAQIAHEKPATLRARVARAMPMLRRCVEQRTGMSEPQELPADTKSGHASARERGPDRKPPK